MTTLTLPATQTQTQSKTFEQLLEKFPPAVPQIGGSVKGQVISLSKNGILVDIEGITTGIVRGKELRMLPPEYGDLKIGDEIEATVIDTENEKGELELSLTEKAQERSWSKLQNLKQERKIFETNILNANKGGLVTKIQGIPAFLPVSQLLPENYPRVDDSDKNKILRALKELVGKTLKVCIINIDEPEQKLIISERAAFEDIQREHLKQLKVGDVIEGKVKGIADFGVFIEFILGEMVFEGLIHISELSWHRVEKPEEVVKVGDVVKAQITSIEGTRVFLSLKRLQKDPWESVVEKYKVDDKILGRVARVNPYGLIVDLGDGVQGLAHVSEISGEPAKEGDEREFKILTIEPENRRITLSMKM